MIDTMKHIDIMKARTHRTGAKDCPYPSKRANGGVPPHSCIFRDLLRELNEQGQ